MTLIIIGIYQSLLTMEKVMASDKHQSQHIESLRKKTIEISKESNWPTKCVLTSIHQSKGCTIGEYHYIIQKKSPSHCSVFYSQEQWWNALFYHIWVWKKNQDIGYFARIVKADKKLTCRKPWKQLHTPIQSESTHSIKFNIRNLAL